jgi:hypothetical protein
MQEAKSITKNQLQSALAEWEQRGRDGNWQPADPATPVDEIAAQNANLLWGLLLPSVPAA